MTDNETNLAVSPAQIQGLSRENKALLAEIVGVFSAQCPSWMEALRGAIARGDAGQLRRIAHTLRGALSNFGCGAACREAERLETLGRAGNLREAAGAVADLERHIQRLMPALAALTAEVRGQRSEVRKTGLPSSDL